MLERSINVLIWERMRQDNEARLKAAQHLVDEGNGHGFYEMAQRYKDGLRVLRNSEEAIRYYKKAAEKNHAGACLELAKLYLQGNMLMGINRDLSEAKKYAKKGSNCDIKAFTDIPNYSQEEAISESKALLQVIDYAEKMQSPVRRF